MSAQTKIMARRCRNAFNDINQIAIKNGNEQGLITALKFIESIANELEQAP